MLCADTQACYGSTRKFKDISRIARINDKTAISCSGELSDFQAIVETFQVKDLTDSVEEDGRVFFSARNYANYLAAWAYKRRRELDPLFNTTLIAGFDNEGKKYLASVDVYGTLLEADYLMGGMANHYCKVILSKGASPDMSEEQARAVLSQCLKILLSGDLRATDKVQFCTITKKGVAIESPIVIKTEWNYKLFAETTNEEVYAIKL
eukprot:TRINITY_DN699_c0_g1_i10.p1 TRINITY_DN699_c0_g1~~TRINITY_DN699_c0_g1_i10.p1  ORF type:complete len:208 (+),score=77.43 TRINITY_DN699_c0_g1_i10:218-841(+)